jgi:translation initiation factor 4A
LPSLSLFGVGWHDLQPNYIKAEIKSQIIVGTPGRIADNITKGYLDVQHVNVFALDEADELFSRGFETSVLDVLKYLPSNVQTTIFAATFPAEVAHFTLRFTDHCLCLTNQPLPEYTLEACRQYYIDCGPADFSDKIAVLKDLCEHFGYPKMLIFCNTRRGCMETKEALEQTGLAAVTLVCFYGSNADGQD